MVADPHIAGAVSAAHTRLEADLVRDLPGLSGQVRPWMAGLSHTGAPPDYFLHPEAYPLVRIPFWLLERLGAPVDDAFAADLVYAALSGYYYLRLMDNLMDGHGAIEREILPAANFFQLGALFPFKPYFEPDDPFWDRYRDWWLRFADATWRDGVLESIDREAFEAHAAQKTCPEKILVAAVCFRTGRADLLPDWTGFAEAFGRWHQMGDDLRDWAQDHMGRRVTYFLSEADRRREKNETVTGWVAREGYHWGARELTARFEELETRAAGLGSPGLAAYLAARKRLSEDRVDRMLRGFQALAGLQEILEG